MKIIKTGLILASTAILFIGVSAFAQKREWPVAPEYHSPTPGEIPIIASYAFWQPELITHEKFEEVHDAGFNMAGQALSLELIDKTLKEIEGTGLKWRLFSWDALKSENPGEIISRYSSNPLVGSIYVRDEPKMNQFAATKKLNDEVMKVAHGKMTSLNLLPAMNGKDLGAPDYRTYVEEFVMQVNPMVLSFDCYPIRVNKEGNLYVYSRYFESYEVISDVARKSGRPFWSYVLATKHGIYPKATENFLRYQVFNALAYGAQGINYYTYTEPDYRPGEYSDAPLGRDGKRTDVWYMVRNVNQEVRNLEKVFLGAEVLDVSHTGASIPQATKRLNNATLPQPFRWIASDGEGVLVSHLKNGDDEYIVIVNRDIENKQKVRFGKNRPVTRIYPDGKEKTDRSESVKLNPGGYAIYRL